MSLQTASFVFDCPQNVRDAPGQVLKMAAKQYWTPASMTNSHGLVLLFAHCIGGHKEQWEPTIERIFALRPGIVREVWAFDWQTHGESAVLNSQLLRTSPSRVYGVSALEWSDAIAAFVNSPRMRGKRIVPIGHSAGAGTMSASIFLPSAFGNYLLIMNFCGMIRVLTTKDKLVSEIPYASFILIEPTIISRDLFYAYLEDRAGQMEFVVAATTARRERWRSREDAHSWMSKRVPWELWDPRVVRKLNEHGLADAPDGGVAIKGDRLQEALSYPDVQPHFDAAQELCRISLNIPVHFIWGGEGSLVPQFVQDALAKSDGRVAASVTRIDAGHMVVQEQPDAVADKICAVLDTIESFEAQGRSKL
ncbi:AB hydrolase-1 domain-containing protein [Mycena sanguinolenta]|uniref:AB hydrolase-1 domain-containing protein n=1 Tax=Mycena sanguinolenta TaxID=230812 RepID=A0A8H6XP12_9AGAR|nr:AB hydrolase-1 domain-containing protein [Mycena sanguinolenta]